MIFFKLVRATPNRLVWMMSRWRSYIRCQVASYSGWNSLLNDAKPVISSCLLHRQNRTHWRTGSASDGGCPSLPVRPAAYGPNELGPSEPSHAGRGTEQQRDDSSP